MATLLGLRSLCDRKKSSAPGGPASGSPKPHLNHAPPGPDELLVDVPRSSTPVQRISGVRGAGTVLNDLATVSGARLVSAVISVATVILTTRILLPAQYALVAYVAVVGALMFTTTSAWTAAAVTRYGREELELRRTMTSTSWNRLLVTAPLILMSIAIIVILRLAGALPPEMTWTFVGLSIASGALLIASEHIVTLLEAAGRMRRTAIVLTLRQCASTAVLVVIFVSGRGRSPLVIIALSTITLAIVVVLMASSVWRIALWPPTIDRGMMRRMLAFSVPLMAFSASQYLIQSVDIVILRAYGTRAEVGVYAVAYQGYSVLLQVPTTATIVLTPLFVSLGAAQRHALIGRYVNRAVPQLAFLSAIAVGLTIPLVGIAVPIVFGTSFAAAARPLAVLLTALVFYAYGSYLAPVLIFNERTRAVAAISAAAAVINVSGDVLFVGVLHMGPLGPALATSLALAAIAAGYLIVAERCTNTRVSRRVVLFAPLLAATLPVLFVRPAIAVALGIPAALLATAAILRWRSPFDLRDADMIAKLDMPAAVKRLALRGLHLIAR
jgi:O-antigen/teichoic acid export membrane protein